MKTAREIYEDEYRENWLASLPLETRRIRRDIEQSAKPYSSINGHMREDIFDAMRETFDVGDTFTLSEARARFIEHMGQDISRSAYQNHLYAARNCKLIVQVRKGNSARKQEAIWRLCK